MDGQSLAVESLQLPVFVFVFAVVFVYVFVNLHKQSFFPKMRKGLVGWAVTAPRDTK